MTDTLDEMHDGSDFLAPQIGGVMDAVIESAVRFDPIGYAGTTEPVEVVDIKQAGFDPIAQGV